MSPVNFKRIASGLHITAATVTETAAVTASQESIRNLDEDSIATSQQNSFKQPSPQSPLRPQKREAEPV